MANIESQITDVSQNYYKYLMSLQNVTGIGLGYKRINNINMNEPCIHVLVEKKVNNKYISSNNIIPKNYMGIKTDVIESGIFSSSSNDFDEYDIKIPYKARPIYGGCRLLINNYTGTLGCIVTKRKLFTKQYFVLSTNNVLADGNYNFIGTPIIQDSVGRYKNDKKNIIAYLSNFIPLKYTEYNITGINYVDCAIAKISKSAYVSSNIFGVGTPKGTAFAKLGEKVKKIGYISGVTVGEVVTKSATITTSNGRGVLIYKNQLLSDFESYIGDIGSSVLNEKNEIVGLLALKSGVVSNSDKSNLASFCDINIVIDLLGVDIYIKK